jgi:hypothetical protein
MSGQQVDVLWFEHMGVFSEPIFNFSFVRLTLKQVGTLFGGLLFAYALAAGVSQIAGVSVACLALLITFYRPRVMTFEHYIFAATRFLAAKNQRVAEKNMVAALMRGNEAGQVEPGIAELADASYAARGMKGRAKPTGNGRLFSLFRKNKVKSKGP